MAVEGEGGVVEVVDEWVGGRGENNGRDGSHRVTTCEESTAFTTHSAGGLRMYFICLRFCLFLRSCWEKLLELQW